jgi:hypothetical protein
MYMKHYRIINIDTGETLANKITSHDSAYETLVLLELDNPEDRLEIEPYTPSGPAATYSSKSF